MARYPKDPRTRLGKDTRGASSVVIETDGEPGFIPSPPPGRKWSAETVEWWRAVWGSPVAAALYLRSDAYPLARLGDLLETIHAGEASAALMGEARQLEDRFGLSPASRRRLGVFVDRATSGRIDGTSGVVSLDAARIARAGAPAP